MFSRLARLRPAVARGIATLSRSGDHVQAAARKHGFRQAQVAACLTRQRGAAFHTVSSTPRTLYSQKETGDREEPPNTQQPPAAAASSQDEPEDDEGPNMSPEKASQSFLSPKDQEVLTEFFSFPDGTGEDYTYEDLFEEAEKEVARIFLGIDDPTPEDLQTKLTNEALEQEIQYLFPDSRKKPKYFMLAASANQEAATDRVMVDRDGRPASGAHFTGAWQYYDEVQRLEAKYNEIQSMDTPIGEKKHVFLDSPWLGVLGMENLLLCSLQTTQYRHLTKLLTRLAKDPRSDNVYEFLQRYMKPSALKQVAKKEYKVDQHGYMYGSGKRKAAVSHVWIRPGTGRMRINKETLTNYFDRLADRKMVLEPFLVTETLGKYDVFATVLGGGTTGQSNALRHGIAIALQRLKPELREPLKKAKLLRRDVRRVERKKPGQKKARKEYAWVKR
eukprot:comp23916_c1_seq1/m.42169 comp23916_c1_seq1/g.42169  ORF comp23916_c1_seq1/g.42169 comp23916_c1_seq1/m.42169 type:complete len:446 (-) comp23916_c1_seq1:175-1512(-)